MRCFVAIDLPDDLKDTLALAQGALGDAAPQADVRWTPPGSMHVTLQFLGEVPAAEVPAVAGAVAGAARTRRWLSVLRGKAAVWLETRGRGE